MFPTFTGNSRRTRNVNLSGQKNKNPFAATAFSPSAAAGASKTVADAQAERRQRQVERDRLKAAQQIQRSWRGHAVRQSVKNTRRAEFDELYSSGEADGLGIRLQHALPLFFAFFDASNKTDLERLGLLVADLEKGGCKSFARQRQILQALVEALQQSAPVVHPQLLLLLLRIIHANPHVLVDRCQQYYYMLSKYFQQQPSTQDRTLLLQAAYAPLISGCLLDGPNAHHEPWLTSPTHQTADEMRAISLADVTLQEAYGAFASVLLVSAPGLSSQTSTFARHVSISKLAFAILRLYASPRLEKLSRDHLLWLLAHFIALQKAQKDTRREMIYLKALYVQLSALNSDIRQRLDTSGNPDPSADELFNNDQQIGSPLPSFVSEHLLSLVDRDELSLLLEQLKLDHSQVAEYSVDIASLLAGYTLVLVRCFPSQAEDIRMRLYLTDVTSTEGRTPSVKFFWNAVRKTEAFARVVSNPEATLTFLLQRNHFPGSTNDSVWDREWRTILLFLELYIFVLRLTDDEDFRAGFRAGLSEGAAPSRVQQCAMTLDELKSLTLFLKNLAFTLQYHGAELLQDSSGRSQPGSQVQTQTFNVISGMDFSDFKTLVTTSVRLLYERDSRRPFLPAGHWLMTSKFDMEAFLSAVVLEQEQQADMRDTEDGDDDQDADDDAMDVDHQAITLAGQRRSRYAMMESFRQRQRKAQRERTLALIGPKLAVLKNMPYVIPFDIRVQIFRQFVFLDKHRRRHGNIDPDQWRMYMVSQNGGGWNPNNIAMRQVLGKHTATIKRGQLFTDAFRQFFPLGEGLKEPIQITFMDKFDTEEAGIDGGGVTKEFLVSVTREAFSNEHALFVSNSHNALYPNPCALDQAAETLRAAGVPKDSEGWNAHIKNLLERFEFLGRVVGKCLYEGILIDVAFAGFFLLNWTWAGTDSSTTPRANINDLRELDEELYQGMLQLKHYPGDVAELGLDFTISDQVSQPGEPVRTVTRELVPGGEHQPVTNENRPLYISYVARHRLARQPWAQTRAFIRGLSQIIDPAWLSMFNQSELQRLVGGDSSEIDVEDLRRHTVYSGLYAVGDDGQEHPTVRLFWRVMHELRDEERRDVLKYVTSTPRAPLLGFAQLEPKFSIRDGGRDQDRLPSASTCVNLLKLPQYETAEVLKSKLLYAVTSGAGFDLS